MISKHIFTSDVVSGKQLYINGLNSTGDLIVATTNFDKIYRLVETVFFQEILF